MNNSILSEDLDRVAEADLPWGKLAGTEVLVTGATGFIGSMMTRALLRAEQTKRLDMKVVALARSKAKLECQFAEELSSGTLEGVVADVCDCLDPVGKVSYIIHAASLASPSEYGSDPVGVIRANSVGTMNLLEHGRTHGLEGFLFVSAGEVYGQTNSFPTSERDFGPLDPTELRSCYPESKRFGEAACVAYSYQYGVPTSIARLYHTYGPGIDLNDNRVFSEFAADIVNRRDISIKSSGTARRTFCYISDVLRGMLTILLNEKDGEAYNVSNRESEVSIRELADLLVGLFPEFGLRVQYPPPERDASYLESTVNRHYPDVKKLESMGWKPLISLQEGFKRTIEFYL